jgi:hypothetical protein
MKTKSKILLVFSIAIMLFLIIWCICDISETNSYNYQGYIVSIDKNDENQTVITTISGDKTSEFVLKWYSRKQFKKDTREITVGDSVMLSTTQYSQTNIKKISVNNGYSTIGKLVYVNELPEVPFILAVHPSLKTNPLIRIVYSKSDFEGRTGEEICIYHEIPHTSIYDQTIVIMADAYEKTGDVYLKFTEEELSFIKSIGYTIKE